MAAEALEIWATLDDELGYPTEFVQGGRLQVAVTEKEMGNLLSERDEALRHGLRVEMVDPSEIRDMIPGITGRTLGGLFSTNGGHANTQLTVQAFAWAFQDLGGRLYQNTTVTGIPGRRRPGLVGGDDRWRHRGRYRGRCRRAPDRADGGAGGRSRSRGAGKGRDTGDSPPGATL